MPVNVPANPLVLVNRIITTCVEWRYAATLMYFQIVQKLFEKGPKRTPGK